jgi:flagellar export protein FliJ
MNAFRFPLQKVLDWRRKQLELEEARYKQQLAGLAALDRLREEIAAAGTGAENDVRRRSYVPGPDLTALDRFRSHAKVEEARLVEQRVAAARKAAEQHEAMLAAQRRCRLLERLRERRLADWQAARDRELDEIAAESFLARWTTRP